MTWVGSDSIYEVGDVDIAHLLVHAVRRRGFIAVPQDPFILPDASLRFNLDPYKQHQDAALSQFLKQTGLLSHISSSPPEFQEASDTAAAYTDTSQHSNILDKELSSLPPISTGQTQIFALAQVLLRIHALSSPAYSDNSSKDYDGRGPKPIVILDEVISSLDPETEVRMHELMKEIINKGHTAIIISHRDASMQKDLRSGVDAVLWMEDGKVCGVYHDLVDGGSD